MDNLKPKNVKKTPITMCKTHRRRQFKIGSKKRLKHNMKIVLFFEKKSKKDIVKLNVLQCQVKCQVKCLKYNYNEDFILGDLNKIDIFSIFFVINLGTQFGRPHGYTGV